MTIAKQNYLRQHRYARYKYLCRGGKHKINRSPVKYPNRYVWITRHRMRVSGGKVYQFETSGSYKEFANWEYFKKHGKYF